MQEYQPHRVLHIFGALERGGAESRTMDIYRMIDHNAVQFDFMVHTPKRGAFELEIASLGGQVYHCVPRFRIVNFIAYMNAWRLFLRGIHYDCIHIHMLNVAFPILLVAKQAGVSCRICHSRSASASNFFRKIYVYATRPFIRRLSTHRFAVSDKAGNFAFRFGYTVIKNAIYAKQFRYDSTKRGEIRHALGVGEHLVIGHIGRFHTAKNHKFLLEFFSDTLRQIPHARLFLVGDGELRPQIECSIERLGLSEKVVLLGVRHDIPDLLQAFDLFVLPSLFEGLPGSALEAQAAGLPCLLSDTVTHEAKVIEDLVAFLPINKGTQPWTEAVVSLSKSSRTRRDVFEELKEAGFNIDDVAVWYEDFYRANM